jgi:uncharacterized iron-regulated protein
VRGDRAGDRIHSDLRSGSGLLQALAVLMVATIAILATSAAAHSEACAPAVADTPWHPPAVVTGAEDLDFEGLVAKLAEKRVVTIGEVHDRYDHHLNQLELVCRLHRRHADLAIGLEFFQQPFQGPLDAYLDLRIDTSEMLAQTEYYDRWHFDYRLYAPILEFARGRGIPVVALNAPKEISSKVAQEGISSLSDTERAQFPAELDHDVPGYRERLQAVFDEHPEIQHMNFENFVEAQLIWDESMAERAARYLEAHPDAYLVVLAGDGHITRSGIPARFTRRSGVEAVNVLQGELEENAPQGADYVLVSEIIELPRGGMLGVMLDTSGDHPVVSGFAEDSAAKDVGILDQDRIVELDGNPIASLADLKVLLMEKRPGDAVSVKVERVGSDQTTSEASFGLTLR